MIKGLNLVQHDDNAHDGRLTFLFPIYSFRNFRIASKN